MSKVICLSTANIFKYNKYYQEIIPNDYTWKVKNEVEENIGHMLYALSGPINHLTNDYCYFRGNVRGSRKRVNVWPVDISNYNYYDETIRTVFGDFIWNRVDRATNFRVFPAELGILLAITAYLEEAIQ